MLYHKNNIMKLLFVPVISFTLISGCAVKTENNETKVQSKENNFFKYDNKNHILGDKNNYIKKVTYTEGSDKRITFYIDKFPYKKEFNLCNKNDFIQDLKNNYKNAEYKENDKNTCRSYIYMNKEDNLKVPYWTSFNFNFLDGADYNKQYNLFLESTSKYSSTNSFFKDGSNEIDNFKKINFLLEK
jgi:hypothetical protein